MIRPILVLGLLGLAVAPAVGAQSTPAPIALDSVAWRPSGGGLETAVINGNPQVAGESFTMLLRLGDGAWIPPHTHNVDKRLLVLRGRLLVGYGTTQVAERAVALEVGDFLEVPADQPHYEGGSGETIVALYAIGPFRTTMLPAVSP